MTNYWACLESVDKNIIISLFVDKCNTNTEKTIRVKRV